MKKILLLLIISLTSLCQPAYTQENSTTGFTLHRPADKAVISQWTTGTAPPELKGYESLRFGYGINQYSPGWLNLTIGNYPDNNGRPMPKLSGSSNTRIGINSGWQMKTAAANTLVGMSSGALLESGRRNVKIGFLAGAFNVQGHNHTILGYRAGAQMGFRGLYQVDGNTYLGFEAGYQAQAGTGNTYVGDRAGRSNFYGKNNVFIGRFAGQFENSSNKLYISNSSTSNPLIWGDFQEKKLKINGNLIIAGTAPILSRDDCRKGQLAFDSDYFYVCVSDSKWKRASLHEF